MKRTLVVTNDFPPRQGGIETFVSALCATLPAGTVAVHTSAMPGASAYDATLPYPVVRDRSYPLLPTQAGPSPLLPTRALSRRVVRTFQNYGCDRVLFGAAAPLGLLAPALRRAGARRIVGLTHGHETWWALVPAARSLLHRIGEVTDVLTYVSRWCRDRITPALSPAAAARMVRLSPWVDIQRFRPGCGGVALRQRIGIAARRPVLLCVARLTPRKGQDTLIRALPELRSLVPGVLLVLVGGGPDRHRLERLSRRSGVRDAVLFAGPVPWSALPAWYDAADAFAMPCRTRRLGLEPEALGIVSLEAQACGLPVVVGNSGGAPETVIDGETGWVVDPHDPGALAERCALALRGCITRARGRAWVEEQWGVQRAAETLHRLLD